MLEKTTMAKISVFNGKKDILTASKIIFQNHEVMAIIFVSCDELSENGNFSEAISISSRRNNDKFH